jgi:subtilisin family serine protease
MPAMDQSRNRRQSLPLVLEHLEDRTLLSAGPILDLSGISVDTSHYSATDILVRFRTQDGHATPVTALAGTSIGQPLGLVPGLFEVHLDKGVTVASALAAYRAVPGVLEAEPDYHLSVAQIPNDPLFAQQWDMHNVGQTGGTPGADVHAQQAWNVTTGSSSVIVAVNDTGIDYNHPDLYQNVWLNQAEIPLSRMRNLVDVYHDGYISWRDLNNPINIGPGKITDVNHDGRIDASDILAPMILNAQGQDTGLGGWAYAGNTQDGDTAHPNDFIGWNFVNNTNNPFDDNGHGTHISGTLGASGNNGVGIAGIDWHVQIMPIKFLAADGNGAISAFIAGLNYELAHGAKISNNSWEGAPFSQALFSAIDNARQHGQIFVAAAGNEGSDNDRTPDYPGSLGLNNVVAVAATDNRDNLASFSNWGPNTVALAAPGVDVFSTLPGGNYGLMSGTSMAVPHVTGAMALVWSEHPSWSYVQVIDQVLNTVDKLPSLEGKVATGGRLDVAAAVGWNLSTRTTPVIVNANAQGPFANSIDSLWLTFNDPVDVSSFSPGSVTLIAPNGQSIPITVRVVYNSGDRGIALIFPNQTLPGSYQLSINSNVHDLMGNPMAPYHATFSIQGGTAFTNSTPSAITPGGTTVSLIDVPQNITVGHVQVQLNISYPDDGDLYVHLQGPNGIYVLLVDRRGGIGGNFQNTILDDAASTALAYGSAPFAGTFRPEAPLSQFNGFNSAGLWKLWIQDVGPHSGTLVSWSLLLTPDSGTTGAAVRNAALPGESVAIAGGASRSIRQVPTSGTNNAALADVLTSATKPVPLPSQAADRLFASHAVLDPIATGFLAGKRLSKSSTNSSHDDSNG